MSAQVIEWPKRISARVRLPLQGEDLLHYVTLVGKQASLCNAIHALRDRAIKSDPETRAELLAMADVFQQRYHAVVREIDDIDAKRETA